MMDFLTRLLRWPAEAAARRRIAVAPVRVISTVVIHKPSGIVGMPMTETIYIVQTMDGHVLRLTWSSPEARNLAFIQAMQDWEITHGGK